MDEVNNQAVRPSFDSFTSLNDPLERKEKTAEVDPEEGALYQISQTEGWEIMSAYIKDLMGELDSMVLEAMNNDASFEEIGQKTMVKELAKAYLERVLEKVDAAREAIEEPNG